MLSKFTVQIKVENINWVKDSYNVKKGKAFTNKLVLTLIDIMKASF